MADLEAQSYKMKTELFRYFKNPLYWIVYGAGISIRTVLAYFDSLHRKEEFWELAKDFWSKIGSATMGFLIVLVLIQLFSFDRETKSYPTINSTVYGRIHLFRNRLIAGGVAAVFSVALLAVGNFAVSMLLGRNLPYPQSWAGSFIQPPVVAMIGAIGFFLFAACVCDIYKNQPAAMCICGVPFAISYFVNTGAIKQFELFWFFRYGFFSELMRGRLIHSNPVFWVIWYALFSSCVLLIAINKRKERKEL